MSPSGNPRHNLIAPLLATELDSTALASGYRSITDVDVQWPATAEVTRPTSWS